MPDPYSNHGEQLGPDVKADVQDSLPSVSHHRQKLAVDLARKGGSFSDVQVALSFRTRPPNDSTNHP